MTKLGFLRLSYEKQDTLLKLLILSMAAVLCKSAGPQELPLLLLQFFLRSPSSHLSLKCDPSAPCYSFSAVSFGNSFFFSLCLQLSPQDSFLS